MVKTQSVEFEHIEMVAKTSSNGDTVLLVGTGAKAKKLSSVEVRELRDWLNDLTGFRGYGVLGTDDISKASFPALGAPVTSATTAVVTLTVPEVPANPLDLPAGYVPLESRGRSGIILPGKTGVVPFVSDGRSDASTVAHRIPLDKALAREGMELYDKVVPSPIKVNAGPTPKGARGDGK